MSVTGFNRRRRQASEKPAEQPVHAAQSEPKVEPQPEPEKAADDERDTLAAEYEERFGSKPHARMKAETIREKLDELDSEQE